MNTIPVIEKILVPEEKRLATLPRFFEAHCVLYETLVFNWMDQYCPTYSGGFWEFYELSNSAFLMSWEESEKTRIIYPPNYIDEECSPETVSIVANLFALNQLHSITEKDSTADLYYRLLDYAQQQPESSLIYRVID